MLWPLPNEKVSLVKRLHHFYLAQSLKLQRDEVLQQVSFLIRRIWYIILISDKQFSEKNINFLNYISVSASGINKELQISDSEMFDCSLSL